MSTDYYVYCLVSAKNPAKTYIGMTNNLERRIRQHNGHITGGARSTHAHRPWRFAFYVGHLSSTEARQLEWAMKHKRVAGLRGLPGRLATYRRLMEMERWTRNSPRLDSIRHRIRFFEK